MKWATLACLGLVLFASFIQCQEGDQETTEKQADDVLGRAGLLASDLNVSPTGQQSRTGGAQVRNAAVPVVTAAAAGTGGAQSACCCVRRGTRCPVPYGNGGNGFLDIVNPRGSFEDDDEDAAADDDDDDEPTNDNFDINTRIFNDPIDNGNSGAAIRDCPRRHKRCCYSTLEELASINDRCTLPAGSAPAEPWTQACKEKVPNRPRQCGERQFTHVTGLQKAEASPYEFPWSCLVLDGNNRYIATCAIIPNNARNRVNKGTDRVITVAHRLASIPADGDLKVRVLEYNALGNEFPELEPHQEFRVVRKRLHPQFLPERLSHDMAVLHLDRNIPLKSTRGINAACLPNCDDMFNFRFSNGTGVRCWVAGWGKDGPNGKFQPIQHKVDVPIFDSVACNTVLKSTLLRSNPAVGRRFVLSPSEICAGGEDRKDACEGDGGAPLVCQATSGRWHVVGLVAWGIGCGAKDLPGVYANVYNMLDFILA